MLHNRYGVNNKYFTDAVKRSAERLVNDNLDEYVHEIIQSKADSFMEEMDRVNIRKKLSRARCEQRGILRIDTLRI